MGMKEVGTLKKLRVKVGDVLQWVGGEVFPCTVTNVTSTKVYFTTQMGGIDYSLSYCTHPWEVISRVAPTPKLWRDMTPEEKGALLLAAHEGKVIEFMASGTWKEDKPGWYDILAYRIKPEPKVEVVTVYGNPSSNVQWVYEQCPMDTHRITFNLIDGKPDCASVKMECI
jgi:hypothetical protein